MITPFIVGAMLQFLVAPLAIHGLLHLFGRSSPPYRIVPYDIPSAWFGIIERACLSGMVMAAPVPAVSLLGGWMAMKLATGWGDSREFMRTDGKPMDDNQIRARRQLSLLMSLLSMFFCYFGSMLMAPQCLAWAVFFMKPIG